MDAENSHSILFPEEGSGWGPESMLTSVFTTPCGSSRNEKTVFQWGGSTSRCSVGGWLKDVSEKKCFPECSQLNGKLSLSRCLEPGLYETPEVCVSGAVETF